MTPIWSNGEFGTAIVREEPVVLIYTYLLHLTSLIHCVGVLDRICFVEMQS